MADLKTTAEERATWRQHAEACPAPRCVPCKSDLRILSDLDTLLAENARLLAVAEALKAERRILQGPPLPPNTKRSATMQYLDAQQETDAALAALEAP